MKLDKNPYKRGINMLKSTPTYLEGHIKNNAGTNDATLYSSTGGERFEIWYYGALFPTGESQNHFPHISGFDFSPLKIVARDTETGENLLLFDRASYGYSALFRDVFSEPQKQYRPLIRYEAPAGRIHIDLEYGVPYERERSKFHFNAMGYVLLRDGRAIPWEQAKRDGFTQISLSLETEEGEIIEFASEYLAYSIFIGDSQAD